MTALRLFAQEGYEAVSVSMIAGRLGMVKSALYKHYQSKRDIFDCIVNQMSERDRSHAEAHGVPQETQAVTPRAYQMTNWEQIRAFTEAMFIHWTQDEFSNLFRRMLTMERYRSTEMSNLYQQYLSSGPLHDMADLFSCITGDSQHAQQLALRFYAPIHLLYSLYDSSGDHEYALQMLNRHLDTFYQELKEKYGI